MVRNGSLCHTKVNDVAHKIARFSVCEYGFNDARRVASVKKISGELS